MSLTVDEITAFNDTAASAVADLVDAKDLRDAVFADEESTIEDRLAAEAIVDEKGRAITLLRDRFNATFRALPDYDPPTVLDITPANGATGIAAGTTIVYRFRKPLHPDTVSDDTIYLERAGGSLAPRPTSVVVLAENGLSVTLTPTAPLAPGARYLPVVTTDVTDTDGNPIPETYMSPDGFTVSGRLLLGVRNVSPADGSSIGNLGVTCTVEFEIPIHPATAIPDNIFLVADDGSEADVSTTAITLDETGKIATLTLSGPLTVGASYKIKVQDVQDLAGNAIEETLVSATAFRISDETIPIVDTVFPSDDGVGLLDTVVSVLFGGAILESTATPAHIRLVAQDGSAADVATTAVVLSEGGTLATLTLDGPLTEGLVYKHKVTGVLAADGKALDPYTDADGFTAVASLPDTTAPYVASVFPADGATGIPTSVHPSITFPEPMDPATINGPNDGTKACQVFPSPSGDRPAGTWTLGEDGLTATLVPDDPLAAGQNFHHYVESSNEPKARDLAGNALDQTGHLDAQEGSVEFESATGFTTAS